MEEKVTIEFSGAIKASFDIGMQQASRILVFIADKGNNLIEREEKDSTEKHAVKNKKRKSPLVTPTADLRDELKNMELVPDMEGYPNFHDITKSDQVLWLLIFAQKKGISALSSAEIASLADRLSVKISSNNISGLTETARNKGRIIKNPDNTLKAYKPGMDYLASLLVSQKSSE